MAERLTPARVAAALTLATPQASGTEARRLGVVAALDGAQFREFWKYTPAIEFVRGLEHVAVTCPALTGFDQPGVRVERLSARGQGLSVAAQDLTSVSRFPLAELAALIAGDALIVDVEGELSEPLQIDHAEGLGLPVVLRLAPGANAGLIERAEHPGFANQSLYIQLREGARLTHASLATSQEACHWSLSQVLQSAGSHYVRQQYATGGLRRRTECHIVLLEPGSHAEINGAYVVDGGSHLDQQLVIEHRAPSSTSRQRFHGIGAGRGTAVFNGRIHIHAGAPGADAALTNRNLALHPDAVINTKPELEIYTDDVKCSHGATVGRLSEESLFYLRSRGIGRTEARRMLCQAFIRECLSGPLAAAAETALLGAWLEADE